jgi:hypothetical protein
VSLLRIEVRPVTTAGGDNDVEMDGAAAAHGKLDAGVELSGDDNEMKAKVSIARARLLSFIIFIFKQIYLLKAVKIVKKLIDLYWGTVIKEAR